MVLQVNKAYRGRWERLQSNPSESADKMISRQVTDATAQIGPPQKQSCTLMQKFQSVLLRTEHRVTVLHTHETIPAHGHLCLGACRVCWQQPFLSVLD